MTDAERWYRTVYGSAMDSGLWVSMLSVRAVDKQNFVDWLPVHDVQRFLSVVNDRQDCDVWAGIALRKERVRGRGGVADCALLPALWLDIDCEFGVHATDKPQPEDWQDAQALLSAYSALLTPPELIVSTGGGYHAYWSMNPAMLPDAAQVTLRGWFAAWKATADRFGWMLDNVYDLPRVMRVPGTFNYKGDEPVPVTIKETN
jgi:hypothetical protein